MFIIIDYILQEMAALISAAVKGFTAVSAVPDTATFCKGCFLAVNVWMLSFVRMPRNKVSFKVIELIINLYPWILLNKHKANNLMFNSRIIMRDMKFWQSLEVNKHCYSPLSPGSNSANVLGLILVVTSIVTNLSINTAKNKFKFVSKHSNKFIVTVWYVKIVFMSLVLALFSVPFTTTIDVR